MNWIEFKNLQLVSLNDIPRLSIDELRMDIIREIKSGKRLVQFFGKRESDSVRLISIIADDNASRLFVASTTFTNEKEYESITKEAPQAHMFEREFYEQFGIKPVGHPWLKPVRKGIVGINSRESQYEFFSMAGEDVHEVGVGPVHAGIIEPGHFRFSCHGEKVHHLEIELGFQHRGVEELFVRNSGNMVYLTKLSESIAGDTVIGHAGAFARAVESLAGVIASRKVKTIRSVMLELERIGIHLGDLSALSNDVAYLTGNNVFGAMRTLVINTSMSICGNRFGRGIIAPGGVNFDISPELKKKILSTLNQLLDDVSLAGDVLFASASVMERFEKTGIVNQETAASIGMVGPAARASGVSIDVRSDHPFDAYEFLPVHKLTLNVGDVFNRAYIRLVEIQQSIRIINDLLNNNYDGELSKPISSLHENSLVVSLAEGWRGEIAHVVSTDGNGKIAHVKIKDPSFHNWFGLALALREEDISDFPLCNKSFNLSYCGFDL
ncbi:MAG: NADH-quinone oxidoreductase subunit C [bacterium]